MLNVCELSRYHSPVVEVCYMLNVCVGVVPLSQRSVRGLLYVKCLCELSRYHSPVVEVCYMLNVCELSRYHSPVVDVCYMLNVCASCPVITAE